MIRVSIEKRKNYKHIVGKEKKEVFGDGEIEEKLALHSIREVIWDYQDYISLNGSEVEETEKIKNCQALKTGFYVFDCGDFSYYIEIIRN